MSFCEIDCVAKLLDVNEKEEFIITSDNKKMKKKRSAAKIELKQKMAYKFN